MNPYRDVGCHPCPSGSQGEGVGLPWIILPACRCLFPPYEPCCRLTKACPFLVHHQTESHEILAQPAFQSNATATNIQPGRAHCLHTGQGLALQGGPRMPGQAVMEEECSPWPEASIPSCCMATQSLLHPLVPPRGACLACHRPPGKLGV